MTGWAGVRGSSGCGLGWLRWTARLGATLVPTAVVTAAVTALALAAASARTTGGRIVRLDPRFDSLIPRRAALERVAEGFTWVEGPVWDQRHQYLLVSDIPNNAVYRIDEGGGVALFLHPSGYTGSVPFAGREPGSNGLAFDSAGRLVLAEHGDRRVTRLETDGRKTVLAERYQGRRLNSPNDLVFAVNGDLYFTDPPFGLPGTFDDPARELPWTGVYRLSTDGHLTLVTAEVQAANGIALSPDERTLYVSNADRTRAVYLALSLSGGDRNTPRVVFDATSRAARFPGAPDGIEVDRHGNLFAVGPGGVLVLTPDGDHLGTLETGVATSNVAWGGPDRSHLYITAGGTIYRVRTATGPPEQGHWRS